MTGKKLKVIIRFLYAGGFVFVIVGLLLSTLSSSVFAAATPPLDLRGTDTLLCPDAVSNSSPNILCLEVTLTPTQAYVIPSFTPAVAETLPVEIPSCTPVVTKTQPGEIPSVTPAVTKTQPVEIPSVTPTLTGTQPVEIPSVTPTLTGTQPVEIPSVTPTLTGTQPVEIPSVTPTVTGTQPVEIPSVTPTVTGTQPVEIPSVTPTLTETQPVEILPSFIPPTSTVTLPSKTPLPAMTRTPQPLILIPSVTPTDDPVTRIDNTPIPTLTARLRFIGTPISTPTTIVTLLAPLALSTGASTPVLIPVTGVDLTRPIGANSLSIFGGFMTNIGLFSLGMALVLTGISSLVKN